MIKSSDLRIGNWVRIRGYILCVKAIAEKVSLGNSIESDFIHDEFDYSQINGIELTPEILRRYGCKESGCDDIYVTRQGTTFFFDKGEATFQIENKHIIANSLHKLQNVLGLTGEELQVNL